MRIKKFILFLAAQSAISASVMADPENKVKELLFVNNISSESLDYPFAKTIEMEKNGNFLKVEFNISKNNPEPSLMLLPAGLVWIKRSAIELDKATEMGWIRDLFDEPQKNDNSLLELSPIEGEFVIRFADCDLLVSFFERSDKVIFATIYKLSYTVTRVNNTYFVGSLPSSDDKSSWRRTNDARVMIICKKLFPYVPKGTVIPPLR